MPGAIALMAVLAPAGLLAMIVASFLTEPPAILSTGAHWTERLFNFGLILFAIALVICEGVGIVALFGALA